MSQVTKEMVMEELQKYVKGSDFYKVVKSKPKKAEQIRNIKLDDLILGETATAKFVMGYFNCNVRCEGFKRNGDVEHTRTLNFNYTTNSIGFVDDGNTANFDELYYAAQVVGMHMYNLGVAKYAHLEQLGEEIYAQDESELALIRNVLPVCRREHEKLGFTLLPGTIAILESDFHREGETELPICPIYANIANEKGKIANVFLGYFIEIDDEYVFTINANDLIKKHKNMKSNNPDKKVPVGKIIKWLLIAGVVIAGIVIAIVECT